MEVTLAGTSTGAVIPVALEMLLPYFELTTLIGTAVPD